MLFVRKLEKREAKADPSTTHRSITMLISQAIESRLKELPPGIAGMNGDKDSPSNLQIRENLSHSAIARFANDRLGRTDYALYSAGAKIIPTMTSRTFDVKPRKPLGRLLSSIGLLGSYAKPPSTILNPDTHLGQCWPMAGSEGQVAVRLPKAIKVSEFGLEHVAKSIAIDKRSAPKDVEVLGYLIPDNGEDPSMNNLVTLARHTYEPSDDNPMQTFTLLPDAEKLLQTASVRSIVLRIHSNWGHPDHTCILSRFQAFTPNGCSFYYVIFPKNNQFTD